MQDQFEDRFHVQSENGLSELNERHDECEALPHAMMMVSVGDTERDSLTHVRQPSEHCESIASSSTWLRAISASESALHCTLTDSASPPRLFATASNPLGTPKSARDGSTEQNCLPRHFAATISRAVVALVFAMRPARGSG